MAGIEDFILPELVFRGIRNGLDSIMTSFCTNDLSRAIGILILTLEPIASEFTDTIRNLCAAGLMQEPVVWDSLIQNLSSTGYLIIRIEHWFRQGQIQGQYKEALKIIQSYKIRLGA
jgi:hypothetical protein